MIDYRLRETLPTTREARSYARQPRSCQVRELRIREYQRPRQGAWQGSVHDAFEDGWLVALFLGVMLVFSLVMLRDSLDRERQMYQANPAAWHEVFD